MTGTFFFVHGTGVRQADYENTLDKIRRGCANQPGLQDVQIADNCSWGEALGTSDKLVQQVLPPEERTRALAPALTPEELDRALWSLLLDDPLFELRIAAQQPPTAAVAIGQQAADAAIAAAVQRVIAAPPAVNGLDSARISSGAKTVAAAPELPSAALAAGDAADPELVETVARAIIAAALKPQPGEVGRPGAALDATLRDAAVKAIADALAPQTRGLRSWLKDKVTDTIKGIATSRLQDRRASVTGDTLTTVGDIFFHLRRGSIFLDFVIEKMQPWPQPLVAVGHSLGGVMLVDLLSRAQHPPVEKLVTVGSQAPLFYAVDSLENLRTANAEPKPFVPWLNIYDRADFLSYLAADVFPDPNIRDEAVSSGVPFPDAHSAYWENPRTYELIAGFWP